MAYSPGGVAGLLAVGLAIGGVSGMLGIGGGVFIIPALTFLFGFTQQKAVGTSLGIMLPPIGIFAALKYHRDGNVDLPAAALMAAGFAAGAYFGALAVGSQWVPERGLRLMFAFLLLYVAGNILFRSDARVAAVAYSLFKTAALMLAFAGTFFFLRRLGRRWERSLSIEQVYRRRLEKPLPPDYEI